MNNSVLTPLNNSWLIPLLIVLAILIVGSVFLRLTGKHRKRRHARKAHYSAKRTIKRIDHGAHIAQHHGVARSPMWAGVARAHRLREPACVVCGYKGAKLQVHHIKPFHLHPQLELDPNNLITLCEVDGREHHLLLGHLDKWESYNVHIRDDVKRYHRKTAAQIRADLRWQKMVLHRP